MAIKSNDVCGARIASINNELSSSCSCQILGKNCFKVLFYDKNKLLFPKLKEYVGNASVYYLEGVIKLLIYPYRNIS